MDSHSTPPSLKFIQGIPTNSIDRPYTCQCKLRKDVILECGHSLCFGCMGKLRRSLVMGKVLEGEVKCEKCLARVEVTKRSFKALVSLPCGCAVNGSEKAVELVRENEVDVETKGK
eukprot:TRINITY_DN5641_c0_g4_i1.p2 TRINITY_DN5641_c0_g4~~TRINITY_DN5641_c0_g4_i1.p2  ORF type:complete len:116 (+),score=13.76 TRINITY_DN5641_c0_g4_i1:129-476(+)